jgi:hypothetical protein
MGSAPMIVMSEPDKEVGENQEATTQQGHTIRAPKLDTAWIIVTPEHGPGLLMPSRSACSAWANPPAGGNSKPGIRSGGRDR